MKDALMHNHALRQSVKTGLLTAAILLIGALGVANLRIATVVTPRTADGYGAPVRYTLAVTEVWSLLLDRLPFQAPAPLERGVLLLLLAAASVALAYALAAALRLPGAERGTREAE